MAAPATAADALALFNNAPEQAQTTGEPLPAGRYAVETKTGTGSTDVGVDTDATSPNRIVAETATGSIDIND